MSDKPVKLKLLIVEDHHAMAANIGQYMEELGHDTDFAYSGTQGLALALENFYDVIILDLMLPGMDGLQVCQQFRQQSERYTAIIMLTARDTLADKLSGFEHGADDYLTKPFALEELHMRCLSLAKRQSPQQHNVVFVGDLRIDREQHTAFRKDQQLVLSSMGFTILHILAEAYPRVVSRSELSQRLWGDEPTESDALRSHIYQLRKVVDKPFDAPLLKTVHGVGFTLEANH